MRLMDREVLWGTKDTTGVLEGYRFSKFQVRMDAIKTEIQNMNNMRSDFNA